MPAPFQLNPELIVSITGAVISLVFSYFPGLRQAYASMPAELKSAIMILLMAGVVAAIVALNCSGWIQAGISCDSIGIQQVVWWYILALIANQGVYQVSPQPADVRQAKIQRGGVINAAGE